MPEGCGGRVIFRLMSVTNGVLQGSVCGLYNVHVNRLVSLFADDTKITGVMDCEEGCQTIQFGL